ncbi:MAG TPA: hypothetical protein VF768_05285 [Holophagaceae bacterium]
MSTRSFQALLLLALALPASGAPTPDRHDPPWREHQDRDRDRDRDDDRRDRDDRRRDRREDRREDRWEHDREGRRYPRYRWEDRRTPGRYLAPPWMAGYWRPHERRYVALIPGDPSRCYVFVDGRWLLRRIEDPDARLDLEAAFGLPLAPPPVPPPQVGLGINLHIVLFH